MSSSIDIKKLAEEMQLDEEELVEGTLEIKEVYGTDRIGVSGVGAVSNKDVQALPLKLAHYINPRKEENGEIGTVVFTSEEVVEIELDDRFNHIETEQFTTNTEQ